MSEPDPCKPRSDDPACETCGQRVPELHFYSVLGASICPNCMARWHRSANLIETPQ